MEKKVVEASLWIPSENVVQESFTRIELESSLTAVMKSSSVVQLGLLLAVPMLIENGLERGFRTALCEFIMMQLQLGSVFFTFSLGTKVHYYGRTLRHGGAKYRATGRGFVVKHATFVENYKMYSRSHFVKAMEIMVLLICYWLYGEGSNCVCYTFMMGSTWFFAISWLFAPFLFNPSGLEWKNIIDHWNKWISKGSAKWELWWEEEQQHHHCGILASVSLCSILKQYVIKFRTICVDYIYLQQPKKLERSQDSSLSNEKENTRNSREDTDRLFMQIILIIFLLIHVWPISERDQGRTQGHGGSTSANSMIIPC